MKNFMFYTTDGHTQDIKNQDIENLQILSFEEAENINIAKNNFITSFDSKYKFENILVREVSNNFTSL